MIAIPRCLGAWGPIIVVIHGAADLRVSKLDVRSVRLEGVRLATFFGIPLAARADVDGDGYPDLVGLIFDRRAIPTHATQLTMTASLHDATPVTGAAPTPPCPWR